MPCEPLKHWFFDLTQVAFWHGQEAKNEFKVSCEPLKHHFLDFIQFAFWAGQEEENEFRVPGDQLKHRFLDVTKVEFCAFKRQKVTFKCHSTSWIVAFSTWKKSHFWLVNKQKMTFNCDLLLASSRYQLQKSCNFDWSRSKKWLQSDIRQFELCWRGRKRVPSAWRPLETSISRPHQSRILVWQDAKIDI